MLFRSAGCPLRAEITRRVTEAVAALPGVDDVDVELTVMSDAERSALATRLHGGEGATRENPFTSSATRVLAIASGKGGVGKSSVTVNLAASIAASGYTVGVLDADIWGFSVPRMLGLDQRLEAEKNEATGRPMIQPNERKVGTGLLKVVSDRKSTRLNSSHT